MSATTPPTCPLGLTPDDLSAWRDHALSPAAEARIIDHLSDASGCLACQRTLAAHDALAAALRAESAPAPDPRNWSQVLARITAASAQSARPLAAWTLQRAQRSTLWGGLSAAAAVLLLSALFFHLFADQSRLLGVLRRDATPVATPTPQALSAIPPTVPIAGTPLKWQARTASATVLALYGQDVDNSFAFSPSDPQTGYLCASTFGPSDPLSIWATHNGAASWTLVGSLPTSPVRIPCAITVDAADPMRVDVLILGQRVLLNYMSDDGGHSWRVLSTSMQPTDLSTHGGASVALMREVVYTGGYLHYPDGSQPHLAISHDDWGAWQPIDSQFLAQNMTVTDVWQRPGDGALLIEVKVAHVANKPATPKRPTVTSYTYRLMESVDQGAHWTALPMPPNLTNTPPMLVAQPYGNAPWQACGVSAPGSGSAASQHGFLGCTSDGGQTWTARPMFTLTGGCGGQYCSRLGPDIQNALLLSDGTIIGSLAITVGDDAADSVWDIFVLAPDAKAWRDVGARRGPLLMYSTPSKGVLLTYAGGAWLNGSAGNAVLHSSYPIAPQSQPNTLFVATVP